MPESSTAPRLILASGSRYRAELLRRLGLPFTTFPPDIDESRQPGEPPWQLAARLANSKAQRAIDARPQAVVIGSDQVAALGQHILGKPGNAAGAREQLAASSGKSVVFYTGCSVVYRDNVYEHTDITTVSFRTLTPASIETYVSREKPYDCAGSFKAEGLGIALFERIESHDPTGIIGLPLIWLSAALRECGADIP